MSAQGNTVLKPATPPAAPASVLEVASPPATPTEPTAMSSRSASFLPAMTGRYLVRAGALVAAVLLWHLASTYGFNLLLNFENVPGPALVGETLVAQVTSTEFYVHIMHSLKRIAIAYAIAVTLGITPVSYTHLTLPTKRIV